MSTRGKLHQEKFSNINQLGVEDEEGLDSDVINLVSPPKSVSGMGFFFPWRFPEDGMDLTEVVGGRNLLLQELRTIPNNFQVLK